MLTILVSEPQPLDDSVSKTSPLTQRRLATLPFTHTQLEASSGSSGNGSSRVSGRRDGFRVSEQDACSLLEQFPVQVFMQALFKPVAACLQPGSSLDFPAIQQALLHAYGQCSTLITLLAEALARIAEFTSFSKLLGKLCSEVATAAVAHSAETLRGMQGVITLEQILQAGIDDVCVQAATALLSASCAAVSLFAVDLPFKSVSAMAASTVFISLFLPQEAHAEDATPLSLEGWMERMRAQPDARERFAARLVGTPHVLNCITTLATLPCRIAFGFGASVAPDRSTLPVPYF